MSRLIDADEALNLIDGETKVETNSNVKAFNDALEVAIQIIDTQKTVKAIPIEWIKKQKVDFQNEDYPFNYCRGFQDGYNDCIDYLVSEWEEENGEKAV